MSPGRRSELDPRSRSPLPRPLAVARSGRRRRTLAIAVLIALGCGGGGSGGGSPTQPGPPPPPPTGVFFTPDGPPGEATIYLQADERTPLTAPFVVRVMAEEVTDLYGVAFELHFPDNILGFRQNRTELGGLLTEDGEVDAELLIGRSSGVLTIGLSRLGEVPGVDGSGTLMTLEFAIRDSGQGDRALEFQRNDARDSAGRILADMEWIGASLEIRR